MALRADALSSATPLPGGTRWVLALADDAEGVKTTPGVSLVDEAPGVVLAEADIALAKRLARDGEYVGVYSSFADAYRAFSLFLR
jgi:hypothetical protein